MRAIAVAVVLICISSAFGLKIEDYSAVLEIKGGYATQQVSLNIFNDKNTTVEEFRYPFYGNIREIEVFANMSKVEFTREKSDTIVYITARLPEPLIFNTSVIVNYVYNITGVVEKKGDLYILTTSYPLFANVKNFELYVKLPPGYGLAENVISMSPEGEATSDGRRVILHWELHEPIPKEFRNFRVIVLYEPLIKAVKPPKSLPWKLGFIAVVGVLLTALLAIGYKKREEILEIISKKKRLEEKIEILKEDEQKIMRLIIENNGIDQRDIVRITGFSKAKVSKILSELEKRGAIVKKQYGRRNKIYLAEKD